MNINDIQALNKSLAGKIDDIAAELRGAIESVKQGPGRKVFYRRGDIEKIKAGEWPNIF